MTSNGSPPAARMAKRRQIREAAVQLLYCAHLRGGTAPAEVRERFWHMASESARRQLLAATQRCILHLGQHFPIRHAEWLDRLPTARATIAANPDATPLTDALSRADAAASRLTATFHSLDRLPLDGHDDQVAAALEPALDHFFATLTEVRAAARGVADQAADFPTLAATLDPLLAALRRLDQIAARLEPLRQPAALPDQPEYTPVREAAAQLDGLREGAEEFVDQVLGHLDEIDPKLAAIVENYAPDRLDLVDRSILRLAAWEILFNPAVPNAVAINEAVEIAKRFGTSDSARFVNGILDRLAREST